MKRVMMISTACLALAACQQGSDAQLRFDSEVGTIEGGVFGEAVSRNRAINQGEIDFAVDFNNRFAAAVNPTVNFDFNSATLDAEARAILDAQADFIRQFPEVRFKVFGHTDLVGSSAYNQSLGQRRANAVVAYLISRGISRNRLEAVVSRGETQPLIVTQGRERANRRTVTEVTGFVQSHPLVLDGKYAQIIYREYVASATAPTGLTGLSGAQLSTDQ